jgi:hypothetical protein
MLRSYRLLARALIALILLIAPSASAQTGQATDADTVGVVTISAGVDFATAYMLRGFRQDDSKLITSPRVDVGVAVYRGNGMLKSVTVGGGMWNSLNPGDAGRNGASGELWYERRFNGTAGVRFGSGLSIATTYTAYTSPNSMFTTVKETALSVGLDDHLLLHDSGINPYALFAFELDTAPGVGQLDGGFHAGRYLELGVDPGYVAKRVHFTVPVKVGLSLSDYYELGGEDHTFGFASLGATIAVPLTRASRLGRLTVRGGIEVQRLGEATRVFNDGERMKAIGSFGIGWQP